MNVSHFILACACFITIAHAQVQPPRTFFLDAAVLAHVRESVRAGDKDYMAAMKRLTSDAEKALKLSPVSVMEKKQVPPSGDKHDYMSLAPYWWPDPTKPGGLPYIRRDGEVNPEREEYKDKGHLLTLTKSVHTLALAYYYTGKESYAAHAGEMIRTWFLNPATRMNPNLNYGQSVRGRNDGRGAGLIETSRFRYLIDAFGFLESSSSFAEKDRRELREWFSEYFRWLQTSKNGVDESKAKNNHGTWYDVQYVAIALYLGDTTAARTVLREASNKRIATQIEPDGKMPLELVRTKALGYTTMNIEGFFYLATLAAREQIDLWRYSTTDGRSMKKALDWVMPFWSVEKSWEYKQIKEFDYEYVYGILIRAASIYNDERYRNAARALPTAPKDSERALLMFGTPGARQ